MKVQITKTQDGRRYLALVTDDGELFQADESHPRWDDIVTGAAQGDPNVIALFDVAKAVTEAFRRVTERVVFRDGQVLFDGDPIDAGLEGKILEFYKNDEDFAPFVAFLERLMNNPDQHSREQLYSWLTRHNLTITKDGYMVAYKGLRSDFTSSNAGPGIVNGVEQNGHLDNTPGNVLEMARSKVTNNPNIGCAAGLHVANWRYAESWSSTHVAVLMDPRDIVSVPNDSNFEKIRVARYTVIEQVEAPYEGLVIDKTREELLSGGADEDEFADEDDVMPYLDEDDEDYDEDEDDVQDAPVEDEAPQDAPVFQVGDRVVKTGDDHYTSTYGGRRNWHNKEARAGTAGVIEAIRADGDLSVRWDTPVKSWVPTSRIKPENVHHEDTRPVTVQGLKPLLTVNAVATADGGVKANVGFNKPVGRPTDKNHLKQKRGPGGRFLPKGS